MLPDGNRYILRNGRIFMPANGLGEVVHPGPFVLTIVIPGQGGPGPALPEAEEIHDVLFKFNLIHQVSLGLFMLTVATTSFTSRQLISTT